MSKIGRPEKEIDLKQLETLCGMHCTDAEIAAVLGITPRTLARRKKNADFAERMARGRALGLMSLRRLQWESAQGKAKGAVTMQIWLGKQLLGQKNILDHTVQSGPTENREPHRKLADLISRLTAGEEGAEVPELADGAGSPQPDL